MTEDGTASAGAASRGEKPAALDARGRLDVPVAVGGTAPVVGVVVATVVLRDAAMHAMPSVMVMTLGRVYRGVMRRLRRSAAEHCRTGQRADDDGGARECGQLEELGAHEDLLRVRVCM